MALIILIIISIFIPPMWLMTGIYFIYLLLTAKNRRNNRIETAISIAIKTNTSPVIVPRVTYREAKNYALDNGATLSTFKNDPDDDTLCFFIELDNGQLPVTVQRDDNGGTLLYVNEVVDLTYKEGMFKDHINSAINK
jgi:hypothetical protein